MTHTRPIDPRSRETGSAYIVALFVLVVLTALGLSLSLITETESQIGANERGIQRIFSAAEIGAQLATAKALTIPDSRALTIDLPERDLTGAFTVIDRVDVSPMVPIHSSPCNLCQINQGAKFFKLNHAVTTNATRLGWSPLQDPLSDEPTNLAASVVGLMIDIQPMRPSAEPLAVLDQEALGKISF